MVRFSPMQWVAVYAVLAVSILLATEEIALLPDGRLHAFVLDVGQGDSILLVSPSGKQILIDGGPDLSTLEGLPRHLPFFDRTIELLVFTHPDADHITALPDVLRRYHIARVLLTGIKHDSQRYHALVDEIARQNIPALLPDPSVDIDMGDGLVLDVVWPTPAALTDEHLASNNTSIVLRALAGSSSILLTGDIEEPVEQDILATGADIGAGVLKVAHHGSKTSSSTGFLLAVRPDLGVISVAAQNRYGHPHRQITDRFRSLHIPLRQTALEGTIDVDFPAN